MLDIRLGPLGVDALMGLRIFTGRVQADSDSTTGKTP